MKVLRMVLHNDPVDWFKSFSCRNTLYIVGRSLPNKVPRELQEPKCPSSAPVSKCLSTQICRWIECPSVQAPFKCLISRRVPKCPSSALRMSKCLLSALHLPFECTSVIRVPFKCPSVLRVLFESLSSKKDLQHYQLLEIDFFVVV